MKARTVARKSLEGRIYAGLLGALLPLLPACSDGAVTSSTPLILDGSAKVRDAALDGGGSALDARVARSDATAPQRDAAPRDPEICDGLDNDGNGQIDDVDVGGDGICDCLFVATLGNPGPWGQGDVFGAWLSARSAAGAVALGDQQLTPQLLSPYQVIVVQDLSTLVRSYSDQELDTLADWVRAGGGLMTLIGYGDPSERTRVNALLSRFGLRYGDQPILRSNDGQTVPVTNWSSTHPVVVGYGSVDSGPISAVTRVGVDNGYAVEGDGTTLASEGGYDVLKAKEVGSGHVLVWGDEWITYDSEWLSHPEYQVQLFWVHALRWLTTARACQVPAPIYL
jgi:hypothetical protein